MGAGGGSEWRSTTSAVVVASASNTKFKLPKSGSTPNRSELIRSELRKHPGAPIRQIAVAAYGIDDEASCSKVRSLLAAMKARGEVKSVAVGQWEAIAK